MKISIVLMAAGMSSRFGGQPKILSKIGPNNESLFEMSFLQIKDCLQIEQIHLILNEKTGMDIYDEVQKVVKKYNYTVLLTYRFQKIPNFRLKPWGTAEALSLAHEYVEHPCLVLNSDDLFNKKVFENIKEKCIENKNYVIGFRLGGTLSKGQKANRAFINCDEKENVNSLVEKLNIQEEFYCEYELANNYVSVNLFLLQKEALKKIFEKVDDYKLDNPFDEENEMMLPTFINELIAKNKIELELIKSTGNWQGVTFKEDVEQVKNKLSLMNFKFFE